MKAAYFCITIPPWVAVAIGMLIGHTFSAAAQGVAFAILSIWTPVCALAFLITAAIAKAKQ